MNIATLLANAARSYGEQPAVYLGSSKILTYSSLAQRARSLAETLRTKFNFASGDRVGIIMTNGPEYLEVLFATWWAGLVAVPMNSRLHPREMSFIFSSANIRVCFINSDLEASFANGSSISDPSVTIISTNGPEYRRLMMSDGMSLAHVESDVPGWLFYTSGTTGNPKGATLTHRNLMMMCLSYLSDINFVSPSDTIIHAAPMSHGTGLLAIPHVAKASRNVVLESRSLNHDEIINLFQHHSHVTMYHTPTMVKRFVNHPALDGAKLQSLDTIFYGGSPMYLTDLQQAIERLGPRLIQMWAQAETPNTGSVLHKHHHMDKAHPRYIQRLSSAGIARSGVEIRIGDEEDRALPDGELGEVLVRGDVVMAGYWNSADANAETLRNGWLHTGDLGSMDADGFLTIKDRAKDMIISGGFNIYPREIEEVLLQHDDVLEASVIGRPHPDLIEEVVACVVKRPQSAIAGDDLDELCLRNIARFKRPREYFFVQELPKSNYGKVLKRELRLQIDSMTNMLSR